MTAAIEPEIAAWTGPVYAAVAHRYIEAGWWPLPLPAGAKKNPPCGFTGWNGKAPTRADIDRWVTSRQYRFGNVALRMAPDMVGLDIDDYDDHNGAASVDQLAAKHGSLPPTFSSTSRGEGPSRIYFYRVPNGTRLRTDPAAGIDIVQNHHRYAAAWPSTHPETHRTYVFYGPNGELLDGPPPVDELPELPWAWIEALRSTGKGSVGEVATTAEVVDFLEAHIEANNPAAIKGVSTFLANPGGRHDRLITASCWVAREAAAGYYPATEAFEMIEDWWDEVMNTGKRDDERRHGGSEFADATAWGVGQALADPDRVADLRKETPPTPDDLIGDNPPKTATKQTAHYEMSDLGNARRLVAAHGGDIRYVPEMGRWLIWDGTRWENDLTGEVIRRAKVTLEVILDEARAGGDQALFRFGLRSQGAGGIRAAIELATTEPGIPVLVDDLDADPWLLTVGNGTIDLRNGNLRPARREDLITKRSTVAYDPAATCLGWTRFLERILPDPDVRAFVHRLVGCALTGDVSEQILVIFFGTGANGKSVLKETVLRILGDHAMPAAPKLLVETRHDEHPTAIADLCGKRLIVSHEVEDGVRLNETLVKELTGGDRLKARFMRADYFSFSPTFKVWMACNHRPRVRGTDRGIWRRIRLVPFEVTIPDAEQDLQLVEKLRAELPGILAWAVQGCLEWQRDGLGAPPAVVEATDAYRRDSDLVGQFLHEECIVGDCYQVRSAEVYRAYTAWCGSQGIVHPLTQKALAGRLDEAGFDRTENRAKQAVWIGLGVLETDHGQRVEDML